MAGDQRAVEWLIKAGERAQRTYALHTASDRFARASDLLKGNTARRGERGWLLYRAARQIRFSDPERGIAYLEEAERLGNSLRDTVLAAYSVVDRGFLRGTAGDVRGALNDIIAGNDAIDALPGDHFEHATVRNAVADVVLGSPDAEMDNQGYLSRLGGHFNPRRALLVIAPAHAGLLADAVAVGEPLRERLAGIRNPDHHILAPYADVCSGLAIAYSHLDQPDMAMVAFEETRKVLQQLDHRALLAYTMYEILQHVILPYRTDDIDERRNVESEAERLADSAHEAMLIRSPEQMTNFELLFIEGRWREIEEKAPLGFKVVFHEIRRHTHIVLGRIARARGDQSSAWKHVQHVLSQGLATEPGDIELHPALEAQRLAANLALDADNRPAAREWIEAHERWLDWSGAIRGRSEGALLWARYHRLNGDTARAHDRAVETLTMASEPRQPLALISTHRFLGRRYTETRQFDQAEHHLRESLTIVDACAAPYESALTKLAYAELCAETERPDSALFLLEAVQHISAQLGTRRTLARADDLADHISNRHARHAGLTEREVEVLRLAARGLADPEIAECLHISRRTVNTHLTSIYTKLEVHSRTAAAHAAWQHKLL